MTTAEREDLKLRPLLHTGAGFYVLVVVLLGLTVAFIYAWIYQLNNGLAVTALRDWGLPLSGAPMGLYIGTFIWFVGLAHGGIAVSAAIRLMKLEQFRPIARMAELLTLVCLMMAGLMIVVDLGRPDRVMNLFLYWPSRVGQSPITWDVSVVALYFVFSGTYLVMTMRDDLSRIAGRFPMRRFFYRPLLIGYDPSERPKVDRMAWWLAISLLLLLILLSGGVVAWLFGLTSTQAGWFGAGQGPYFLLAALASAIAAVIVVGILLRHIFRWQEIIPADIFRKLGIVLSVLILLYMWMILHEHLTHQFAAPGAEQSVSDAMLSGRFSRVFWTMFAGLNIPFFYFVAQGIWRKTFNLTWMAIAATVVVVALWIKRVLIVIGSLLYPSFEIYVPGAYAPTWVEWVIVIGAVAIGALCYIAFIKIYPIIELEEGVES